MTFQSRVLVCPYHTCNILPTKPKTSQKAEPASTHTHQLPVYLYLVGLETLCGDNKQKGVQSMKEKTDKHWRPPQQNCVTRSICHTHTECVGADITEQPMHHLVTKAPCTCLDNNVITHRKWHPCPSDIVTSLGAIFVMPCIELIIRSSYRSCKLGSEEASRMWLYVLAWQCGRVPRGSDIPHNCKRHLVLCFTLII